MNIFLFYFLDCWVLDYLSLLSCMLDHSSYFVFSMCKFKKYSNMYKKNLILDSTVLIIIKSTFLRPTAWNKMKGSGEVSALASKFCCGEEGTDVNHLSLCLAVWWWDSEGQLHFGHLVGTVSSW